MSGLSRTPGKRVQDNILTGVRIPPSPPDSKQPSAFRGAFLLFPSSAPSITEVVRCLHGREHLLVRLCSLTGCVCWHTKPASSYGPCWFSRLFPFFDTGFINPCVSGCGATGGPRKTCHPKWGRGIEIATQCLLYASSGLSREFAH
jgi:hypothetical protein